MNLKCQGVLSVCNANFPISNTGSQQTYAYEHTPHPERVQAVDGSGLIDGRVGSGVWPRARSIIMPSSTGS